MSQNNIVGLPGVGSERTATPRKLVMGDRPTYRAKGGIISSASRDAGNTPTTVLRVGKLMGKITSGGKFAPAVIGLNTTALLGTDTHIHVAAATAVEMARRLGASGTFKLTGPPAASGTVRTRTVTYSAINQTTGQVDITAVGVAEVQVITPSAAPSVGDWYIRYMGDNDVEVISGAIGYAADAAAIQVIVRATHADLAAVVVTGTIATTVTLTWPLTGATNGPHALVDPFAKGTLLATAAVVSLTAARTATGVAGDFVVSSLVQPVDGSETILTMIGDAPDEYGISLADRDGTAVDVPFALPVIGGALDVAYIVDYPADASLIAYVKAALRAVGIGYHFSDAY